MDNEKLLRELKDLVEKQRLKPGKAESEVKVKYYFLEKIIIPALIPILIGVLAWLTSTGGNEIAENQLLLDRTNQTLAVEQNEKREQIELLKLFYADITNDDTVRQRKALDLLTLMNRDYRDKLGQWVSNNNAYSQKIRDKASSSREAILVEGFMFIGNIRHNTNRLEFIIEPEDGSTPSSFETLNKDLLYKLNADMLQRLRFAEVKANIRRSLPSQDNYSTAAIAALPIQGIVRGEDRFVIKEVYGPFPANGKNQFWAQVQLLR